MRKVILLLVCGLPLCAQVPLVLYPGGPSPVTGGGNAIPFQASFANDIRYQLWIPAADLPAVPMVLSDVAFASTSSGSLTIPTLMFSVGHGTPGAPTCNLAGNSNDLALLYQGAHIYNYVSGSWSSIGVPIAFPYNGTGDLLIELRMLGTIGGSSFHSRDQGSMLRVYNRYTGGFTATTCSHQPSLGLKVELTFLPGGPPAAQVNTLGTGCPGSGGIPTLSSTSLPSIGNGGFSLDISQAAVGSQAWLYAALLPGTPPLPTLGSCTVYLDLASMADLIAVGFSPLGPLSTGAAGTTSFLLAVPNDPGLAGAALYFQGAIVDQGTTGGLTLTNAVECILN